MPNIQKGTTIAGSTVIRSMKDRVIDNETARSVERTVVALYPDYLAFLPAKGAVVGIAGYPLVKYRGCAVQQGAVIGQYAEYVLTYNQQEPDGGEAPPLPILRESAAATPRPWPEHPDYRAEDLWVYWDPAVGAMTDTDETPPEIRGLRFYNEISSQISYTEYFAGDPGSIQNQLGVIGPPPGENGAGDKWMIIDGSRGREGRWWARTLVYGYNGKGWTAYDGKGAEA